MNIPLGKVGLSEDDIESILRHQRTVLESGWVAGLGSMTTQLENFFRKRIGPECHSAIAVSSGTAALHIGIADPVRDRMRRVNPKGIICPAYTFIASAISHFGPILLCDIEPGGCNSRLVDYVKAFDRRGDVEVDTIVVVHQYGIPNEEVGAISEWAAHKKLKVIEDAACAFGSYHKDGRPVGASGNVAAFSMHARKVFTCGEGGIITVPKSLSTHTAQFRAYRNFGLDIAPNQNHSSNKYTSPLLCVRGFNLKMSELQAAMGVAISTVIDEKIRNRRSVFHKYNTLLSQLQCVSVLEPKEPGVLWNCQNLRISLDGFGFKHSTRMSGVIASMREAGVMAKPTIEPIHWMFPRPEFDIQKPCDTGYLGNTEAVYRSSMWLPFYENMTDDEISFVVETLKNSIKKSEVTG